MVISVKLLVVMVGALVAFIPVAEARNCKATTDAQAAIRCKNKAIVRTASSHGKAGKKANAKTNGAMARGHLVEFVEARGCKLLASDPAVRRMREIDAVGSVTWDGKCVGGLISGTGVLRQEGVFVGGARSKRFAYYVSGTARNGIRTGRWTRETFERFVDSAQSWTSLARVDFVDGLSKGPPRPVPVSGMDQHSATFRSRVLDSESMKGQAMTVADALPPLTIADTLSHKPEQGVPASASLVASMDIAPSPRLAPPLPALSVTPSLIKRTGPAPVAAVAVSSAPVSANAVLGKPKGSAVASMPGAVSATTPPVSAVKEVAVKLTSEIPSALANQSFAFGTGCYMDTIDGQLWESSVPQVKNRSSVRIQGWGVDQDEKQLPEATYLRLENSSGRQYYAATIPEDRPDVAKHLGQPALVKSGYRALVSAENLPAGEYEVAILMNAGGRNVLCGNGRKLRI